MTAHEPHVQMKDGGDFTEMDGTYVPPTELFRCVCSCGWKGDVWFMDAERAARSYDRHAQAVAA